MSRSFVNRPPTPEAEDRELTLEEKIRYQLYATGERDRLKQLLVSKLEASGWKEEIKEKCRDFATKQGRDKVTVEDISLLSEAKMSEKVDDSELNEAESSIVTQPLQIPQSESRQHATPPSNDEFARMSSEMHASSSLNSLSGVIEAVAHVYAADVGVSLYNETVDSIQYDDANQLLLVTKGGVVFAYDLAMDAPGHHEQLVWTYPILEGPRVTTMRCSLDRMQLGCLRGGTLLELIDLATGNTSVYKSSEPLLGFFFTESPGADVVLVSKSGLELCEYVAKRRGLRGREKLKPTASLGSGTATGVTWYTWTHETRCCLVAMGAPPPPSSFSSFTSAGPPPVPPQMVAAWQFVTAGTITMPPFALGGSSKAIVATATLMNSGPAVLPMGLQSVMGSWGSSLSAASTSSTSAAAAAAASASQNSISQKHVRLLKTYGRVYCAHINVATSKLELYRFYTDAITLLHSMELFTTNLDLSVIDNVIVLHHLDTAMTVLVDVAVADEAVLKPIANPLPLALLSPPPAPPRQPLPASAPLSPPGRQQLQPQRPPSTGAQGARGLRSSGPTELIDWELIAPSTVIDRSAHQAVYRLYLDLRAVADSCGDPVLLASFLQRRRSPPLAELSVLPKFLLQSMLRNSMQEQLPVTVLRKTFQQVCRGWREVKSAAKSSRGLVTPSASAAVLSPEEVTATVLGWYLEQQQQQQHPDLVYLQAAVTEFMAALTSEGLPLPDALLSLSSQVQVIRNSADTAALSVYCSLPVLTNYTNPQTTASAAMIRMLDEVASSCLESAPVSISQLAAVTSAAHVLVMQSSLAAEVSAARHATSALPTSSASAVVEGLSRTPSISAEHAVKRLLASGQVLQAARVARRFHVDSIHLKDILEAAAASRDRAAFATVYRCFRDALRPHYPDLEVAYTKLMLV
ncbi:hypothetical protein CEUSTIGMA_g10958.t1 [Chlamydomonas eustigma]|uniref:Uncharacterized protein n=1 Tax=Chlamydomonas eustigma TaxID=1157962 RepID=A0A250XKI8_9CHLO|nr:hypothetical protein CEUSTIGMA_g10958.t1 [Chlamydomonas eustigma]|eukprot:GAX83533.1 hypothetical protein CEUSTIGMA_g10958.t1 [Chlamydomonas eustigma]